MAVCFKSRAGTAEEWDAALFRLALSTADFFHSFPSLHSVHCWQFSRSPQCTCEGTYIRNLPLGNYQDALYDSILIRHGKSQLLPDWQGDIPHDSLVVLKFILSLSETSQRATELSSFILVYANGTLESDLEITGTTLPTVTGPVSDSVSGINVAQPLGQRRRAGVRKFFKQLIHRP